MSNRFYRLPMNLAMAPGTPDVRKIGFDRDAYLSELTKNGIDVGPNYVEPRVPITGALIGDFDRRGLETLLNLWSRSSSCERGPQRPIRRSLQSATLPDSP